MSFEPWIPSVPKTPIRQQGDVSLISDPLSSDSTLTSLSSLTSTLGNISSPTRRWPVHPDLKLDTTPKRDELCVECDQDTPRASIQQHRQAAEDGDSSGRLLSPELLSPQRVLPTTMKLVPDTSPKRHFFPASQDAAGAGSKHAEHDRRSASSDQEIWVHDPGLDLEWPEDEHEELMETLREEGLVKCVEEYVYEKKYSLEKMLSAFGKKVPNTSMGAEELIERLYSVMRQTLRNRKRIENYSTVNHAVQLLQKAKNIMVISGAGISVSCGIRDFRSKDGIYALIKSSERYPDLEDPQQMFSYKEFLRRPSMFYSFIGQLWPQNVEPSLTHEFIRYLETRGKLLRNYTQNIDSLEIAAGVERVFHCHGSFKTAKCMDCGGEVPGAEIMEQVLACTVPQCASCVLKAKEAEVSQPAKKGKPKKKKGKKGKKSWGDDESDEFPEDRKENIVGVMKPSITFFGEKLQDSFDDQVYADRDKVDLLLIIGSSLKVKPVSEISAHIPHSIPQILINREPIPHVNVDVALLGNCDTIISHLCYEAGWILPSQQETPRQNRRKRNSEERAPIGIPQRLGNSHIWTFEGANQSKARAYAQKFDPSLKDDAGRKVNVSRSDPSLRETKRRRLS